MMPKCRNALGQHRSECALRGPVLALKQDAATYALHGPVLALSEDETKGALHAPVLELRAVGPAFNDGEQTMKKFGEKRRTSWRGGVAEGGSEDAAKLSEAACN